MTAIPGTNEPALSLMIATNTTLSRWSVSAWCHTLVLGPTLNTSCFTVAALSCEAQLNTCPAHVTRVFTRVFPPATPTRSYKELAVLRLRTILIMDSQRLIIDNRRITHIPIDLIRILFGSLLGQ